MRKYVRLIINQMRLSGEKGAVIIRHFMNFCKLNTLVGISKSLYTIQWLTPCLRSRSLIHRIYCLHCRTTNISSDLLKRETAGYSRDYVLSDTEYDALY